MSSESPDISVIIVSYNTREMTLECLRTLHANLGGVSAEVFVVDNDSKDGSVDAIRVAFPQVRLIANTQNTGFGAANNQAMAQAKGEFFLLLNSDAFPKPGAIPAMVKSLREHPKVAVLGPRLLNQDGSLQQSCFRFPSPWRAWMENLWISAALTSHPKFGDYRHWAHDREQSVDFVVGACLLLRKSVYQQVGGFDERFFMYSEESDWQRRISDAGGQIAFTPAAEVIHLGGASGASDRVKINRHFFESLDYYQLKHHGFLGLLALRAAMVVGCSLRAILWTGMMLIPSRRQRAAAKAKLQSWLAFRQLLNWRLPLRPA